MLSGSVLVIQEDVWGNRNILSKVGPGQTFAAAFACAPGSALNVSVVGGNAHYGDVPEREARADRLPVRLRTP